MPGIHIPESFIDRQPKRPTHGIPDETTFAPHSAATTADTNDEPDDADAGEKSEGVTRTAFDFAKEKVAYTLTNDGDAHDLSLASISAFLEHLRTEAADTPLGQAAQVISDSFERVV